MQDCNTSGSVFTLQVVIKNKVAEKEKRNCFKSK